MYKNVISVSCVVGYFAGIPIKHSLNQPTLTLLNKISDDEECVRIRKYCMLRSAMYRNWELIHTCISKNISWFDIRYVGTIFKECCAYDDNLQELTKLGIRDEIIKVADYVNNYIESNLYKLDEYVPYWVNLEAVKYLFKTPKIYGGYNYNTVIVNFDTNMKQYPYQCWVNIDKYSYSGLMFQNDTNFISFTYKQYGLEVSDEVVQSDTLDKLERLKGFLVNQEPTIVVDCENFDPYKLISFLDWTNNNKYYGIQKIILVDDIGTNKIWKDFSKYTSIPVVYYKADRVIAARSNLTMYLSSIISKEYYIYSNRCFILAASNSDYVPLVTNLSGADFFVLYEYPKWSYSTSIRLDNSFIPHMSVESLGISTEDIEDEIVSQEIREFFESYVVLNLDELLTNIYIKCHVTGSKSRKSFIDGILRKLSLKMVDSKLMFNYEDKS